MQLIFFIFAALMIIAAIAVIAAKNPVHSVLYLIFCFFNASALFILLGAEYIAMTLIIVYVGAVAVLFLFVVMMLNIEQQSIKSTFMHYLPLGLLLIGAVVAIIIYAYYNSAEFIVQNSIAEVPEVHNTKALGLQLYTNYLLAFQLCGLILFVAMVGAIVLTVRKTKYVRRQNITKQLLRTRAECVELKEVQTGKGVTL